MREYYKDKVGKTRDNINIYFFLTKYKDNLCEYVVQPTKHMNVKGATEFN